MNHLLALAASALLLSGARPAHAHTIDPLWKSTIDHVARAKQWIAQDVDLSVIERKDGRDGAPTRSHARLTGWNGAKPVYEALQSDPPPEPGKAPETQQFDANLFVAMGDAMLVEQANVERSDGQSLHGKTWTLFHIAKSKLASKLDLKLWVDPDTGCRHYSEMRVHISLTVDAQINTRYAPHAQGDCLPTQTDIDGASLIPFSGIDLRMVTRPSNWIARPK
jgi:hypothetical protein